MGKLFYLLWAAQNHPELVLAALEVASNDGRESLIRPLNEFPTARDALLRGSEDADFPTSGGYVCHLYHFHQPWTHRGLLGSRLSSAGVARDLFVRALGLWVEGKRDHSAYQLGRAIHVLADSWIPYHAAQTIFCGHSPYEDWMKLNWSEFAPTSGGHYEWQAIYEPPAGPAPPHVLDWRNPYDWVDRGAHESWPWFECCLDSCRYGSGFTDQFEPAARQLVPGVIRDLAGFLVYFFALAERGRIGS